MLQNAWKVLKQMGALTQNVSNIQLPAENINIPCPPLNLNICATSDCSGISILDKSFPNSIFTKMIKNQYTSTPNCFSIFVYCSHFKSCKLNMYIIKHLNSLGNWKVSYKMKNWCFLFQTHKSDLCINIDLYK